jgi:hypothetical protein
MGLIHKRAELEMDPPFPAHAYPLSLSRRRWKSQKILPLPSSSSKRKWGETGFKRARKERFSAARSHSSLQPIRLHHSPVPLQWRRRRLGRSPRSPSPPAPGAYRPLPYFSPSQVALRFLPQRFPAEKRGGGGGGGGVWGGGCL